MASSNQVQQQSLFQTNSSRPSTSNKPQQSNSTQTQRISQNTDKSPTPGNPSQNINTNTTKSELIFTPTIPKSYANSLGPNRPNRKKQAVVFPAYENLHIQEYIIEVCKIMGPSSVTHASKISNGRVCLYLQNENTTEKFLTEHKGEINIRGQIITARKLILPSRRLIISNVVPDIPTSCLEEALSFFNIKTLSKITEMKITVEACEVPIYSFRRQVYIHEDTINNVPPSFLLNFDNEQFRLYLTIDELKCFVCNQTGHIAAQCMEPVNEHSNSDNIASTDINHDTVAHIEITADTENTIDNTHTTNQDNYAQKKKRALTFSSTSEKSYASTTPINKTPISDTPTNQNTPENTDEEDINRTEENNKKTNKNKKMKPDDLIEDDPTLPALTSLESLFTQENQNEEGGITFTQYKEYLERTKNTPKESVVNADLMELYIPDLLTTLQLTHPSLPNRSWKIRVTKIINELKAYKIPAIAHTN